MVTNIEAAKLYGFLVSPKADTLEMTFNGNLATQDNIQSMQGFYKSITALEAKVQKPTDAYLEYQRKRQECIDKHAAKDEEGNVVKVGEGVRIENVEEFNKDMEALMSACKPIIEEHENKLREWQEYLLSLYEGDIKIIDQSDVVFKTMSKADFEAFKVMIKQFQVDSSTEPKVLMKPQEVTEAVPN